MVHLYLLRMREVMLTPITTEADDKFCDIFSILRMKYHALFVIFEKAANFEIVCCKL